MHFSVYGIVSVGSENTGNWHWAVNALTWQRAALFLNRRCYWIPWPRRDRKNRNALSPNSSLHHSQSRRRLEVEVMFVDTDYHFDMLRLVTVLENRLAQGTEETIKQCLGRLFLVSCNSSTQLLLTLYSLENLFCAHPSLCVLLLDSLSAFYWIDRSNGGESLTLQEMNLKKCANFLEKLVTQHHLILFATTQTLMQKSANSAESFLPLKIPYETDTDYRPYLCKSWQQMVTHRIFFSKQCNSGNSKGFTVVSCHLKRNQIVKRSFSVAECGVQF